MVGRRFSFFLTSFSSTFFLCSETVVHQGYTTSAGGAAASPEGITALSKGKPGLVKGRESRFQVGEDRTGFE